MRAPDGMRLASVALVFASVQCVGCLELGEFKSQKDSQVDTAAHGEIKVHAVPSHPLTPQEIKDAFHEPPVVMAEVQRLKSLGLTAAVQAIIEGTAKLAAGHKANGSVIDELADGFAVAMRGYTFLEISDTPRPENVRYRKALYVAACASLSAEAQARAASTTSS